MVIQKVDEAEVDEMWSYVGNKKEQRWRWHAINRRLLGHVSAPSRPRGAFPRQAQCLENRTQTPRAANSDQAISAENDRLLEIGPDARQRDRHIHEPL